MSVQSGPNLIENGLVLYLDAGNSKSYPGSGTNWIDMSGNGLNATGTAANISSTGAIAGASWTTATTSILNTDIHSIFFMIRMNSSAAWPNGVIGNWEKIFSFNAAGGDRSPGVWRYPSERYIHWRYNPGNTGADFGPNSIGGPGAQFALNTWYYVGVTKNGAVATSYSNGVNLGTQTVANPKDSGNAPIIVNESYTNGLNNINCLQVYNRVLTPEEVTRNFNSIRGRFGI
jgi:hypothetical protein